jgi:N-dimethylarginine dimethylaminohydrolase|tara:strand:+ start:2709 stop:3713 length:1005 start_codon:yes stop_codon:yes gene_type:complete
MTNLNNKNLDLSPIHVESEWADLKECVYGSPDHWVLPLIYNDAKLRVQGEFGKFWMKNAGRDMKEAAPEIFTELSNQIQGAIKFLEDFGVRVQVAGTISEANRKFPRGEDHGVSTPWMRDPFVTIGSNVIELSPRSLFHRRQRFAIREILASTMERGAKYFAQPDGGADEETNGPGWGYLEGGDVFVLGKNILVGHSGGCSNPEGARWLQHILGSEYLVQTVAIDPMFPHLDCVMMTPREGIVFASMEALPQGLPGFMKDWDVFDIPKALAKSHMSCNNLVLNDQTVVVPAEEELDFIAQGLKIRKFEVVRLPYRVPCMVGGSFRCAHQPLIRV